MNTPDPLLSRSDVHLFYNKEAAVRLSKNNSWYAGLYESIRIDGPNTFLRLDPFIRFLRSGSRTTSEPATTLFVKNDFPVAGSYRENERPFVLEHTHKIELIEQDYPFLRIRFEGGTAELSRRPCDIGRLLILFEILRKKESV